jgi:hypothetical protein
MSRVAVVVTNVGEQKTKVITLLREVTGSAFSVITEAIKNRQPILERKLFYRDHDDVAVALRRLTGGLTRLGADYELYELPEAQAFLAADKSRVHRISPDVLENILQAHEEGLNQQQEIVDRELTEPDIPPRHN